MAERVEINYEQIKQIENRFSQKGDEIDQLSRRLAAQVDNLRGGGWIGRGADAFYAEMDSAVFPTFTALRSAMQETQQALASIANEFTRAEEEARSHVSAS